MSELNSTFSGQRAQALFGSDDAGASMTLLTGNANRTLSEKVASHLQIRLSKAMVGRFSDGEVQVEVVDSVRGRDVFILQSTSAPSSDNLMELLVLIDAVRRASAARITAVIPYFGFARQDRRLRSSRVAITAKLVANMITTAGADRVLTMDLHADQIQGFFNVPVDNIYASPVLLGDVWRHRYEDLMVVSPDVGGVVRARALAKQLDDADLAIIDKRRPRANEARVMNIIGDVSGRTCVLIDDIVDTAGTLCAAVNALKDQGARAVVAYCTHPVLSGPAVENIENSSLDELVVTDTIALSEHAAACTRIRQLSVAELLAESVRRINVGQSMGSLFMD
jgi:ribose-phosphate pyrophosphokinase